MEVPINLVNDIVNYLARQPWREVDNMIKGIVQAQATANAEQQELPLDDTD